MPTPEPKPVDLVAAEAAAIVQQARVTAVVLEARAQATDLVQQARLAGGTPTWAEVEAVVYASPSPTLAGDRTEATPMGEAATSPNVEAGSGVPGNPASPVQGTVVSFAAEGGMIMIRFQAPPEEAETWWPGTVYYDQLAGSVSAGHLPGRIAGMCTPAPALFPIPFGRFHPILPDRTKLSQRTRLLQSLNLAIIV